MKTEIRCPKCAWKPDGGKYWQCSCLHTWNTFDTAGKCPACGRVWRETQCPGPGFPGGCGAMSPHEDWYRNLGDDLVEEVETLLEPKRVKI